MRKILVEKMEKAATLMVCIPLTAQIVTALLLILVLTEIVSKVAILTFVIKQHKDKRKE